jgi:hypothetical protein
MGKEWCVVVRPSLFPRKGRAMCPHPSTRRIGALILTVVVVAGCQVDRRQPGQRACKDSAKILETAMLARQGFYEKSGRDLNEQYKEMAQKYPLVASYIAFHEVALSAAAGDVLDRIAREKMCNPEGVVSPAGQAFLRVLCSDKAWLLGPTGGRRMDMTCLLPCLWCLSDRRYDCDCHCPPIPSR